MNCSKARRILDHHGTAGNHALGRHLAGCEDCRRVRAALEEAREALRSRHAGLAPDAGFAARVRSRLHREPAQVLGLAALRVLPVTLVILALLALLAFRPAPEIEQDASPAPSEDVLAWVLESGEEGS